MDEKSIVAFGYIKTHTSCSSCGNPLIINGSGPVFLCNYCHAEVNLTKAVMFSLIESIYDIVDMNRQKSYSTTLLTKGHSFQFNYGCGPPACPSCEKTLPIEKFRLPGDELVHDVECGYCGFPVPVSRLPGWLKGRFPGMKIAVNAVPFVPDGERERPAIEGIIFSCPKCGGNLDIDGLDRIVHCSFCGGNIYLPDDLWLRLHPVKKITTWWIGFSATKKMINKKKKTGL